MASTLIVTSVESLQDRIDGSVKSFGGIPGIYVSLNKTQKSTESMLKTAGVKTDKLFFIDCVTAEKTRDDVLHIAPDQLDLLSAAVRAFINDIKGKKFLVIDALATLLIYNHENEVARFVKDVTNAASDNDVEVVAFSPTTKGEQLLKKIYNFFDKVK
jgi:KaiC/GvpD/RAD55 family RecA-like ATPase